MSNPGTYTEHIACGGDLVVTAKKFFIKYYFPGPDARHRGEFVEIAGHNLGLYIAALRANWQELLRLKASLPPGGEFTKQGDMLMTIRVGGILEGVYLRGFNLRMERVGAIERVAGAYEYAQMRAPVVMEMLKNLG